MKFFVLTKQKLIAFGCCAVVAVIALMIGSSSYTQVVEASTTEKKNPVYCVETDKKTVSLSFDAAWGNEQTQTLLDILEEKKVKTTFFLVGEWVEKYPDSVKDIFKAGHDVENHSATHAHLPQLSDDDILKELNDCNDKIEELTNKRPTLFRPPYGDYNNSVVELTQSINMYCVQWDIETTDIKIEQIL